MQLFLPHKKSFALNYVDWGNQVLYVWRGGKAATKDEGPRTGTDEGRQANGEGRPSTSPPRFSLVRRSTENGERPPAPGKHRRPKAAPVRPPSVVLRRPQAAPGRFRGLIIDRNPKRLLETAQRLGLHDRITDHLRRHAACGPHDPVTGRPEAGEVAAGASSPARRSSQSEDGSSVFGPSSRPAPTPYLILRRSVLENRDCPHCDHRHMIFVEGEDLRKALSGAKV